MRFLIAAIAVTFSALSSAASLPQPMVFDQRVREVAYNAEDIVTIHAAYGISTHIKFAQDETITHTILGDSVAWETTPVGNNLFIKPVELNADTNLSVVTNKHVYAFDLKAAPKTTEKVFFQVVFIYPDQDLARREAAAQIAQQTARLNEMRAQLERVQAEQVAKLDNAMHDAEIPLRRSINYWVKGSDEAQPDEAYDDGTFTYFRFRGNREFPTVYLRDSKGQDSLVNTTVKGDTILVQRIAKDYVLRKGNDVALVTNPNYDRIGIANETGTITPAVIRTVIGEIDPLPQTLPTRQPAHKVVGTLQTPVRPTSIEPTKTIPAAAPALAQRSLVAPPTALAAPAGAEVEPTPEEPASEPTALASEPQPLPPNVIPLAAPAPVLSNAAAPPVVSVPPYSAPVYLPPPPAVEAPAAIAPAAPLVEVVTTPPAPPVVVAMAPPVVIAPAPPAELLMPPRAYDVIVIEPKPEPALVPRQEPTLPAYQTRPLPLRVKSKAFLRAAPGTGAAKIGSASAGDEFTAIGRDRKSTWYAVEAFGQVGWISATVSTLSGSVSFLPIYKTDAIAIASEHEAAASENAP